MLVWSRFHGYRTWSNIFKKSLVFAGCNKTKKNIRLWIYGGRALQLSRHHLDQWENRMPQVWDSALFSIFSLMPWLRNNICLEDGHRYLCGPTKTGHFWPQKRHFLSSFSNPHSKTGLFDNWTLLDDLKDRLVKAFRWLLYFLVV